MTKRPKQKAKSQKTGPQAAPGSKRDEAKIAARVIAEMEAASGRLVVPEMLVQASRNTKHPLHHRFLWGKDGEAKAAHLHRLDIARSIISSVRVVITTSTHKITSIGYVRDPALPPRESGYVSVARLRTEADNAEEAILFEVNRAVAALERARELAAALDLMVEFQAAWDGAQRLYTRIRKGRAKQHTEERPTA